MSSQVSPKNTTELRKRTYCPSEEETCSEPPAKYAATIQWYQVVLESESSRSSDHDTESVHSIQDKETDYARDTTDTSDTDSDVEYEVASLSEDDEHVASFWGDVQSDSSSGTDDVLGVDVLAAICSAAERDSDIGLWAADTDGESQQEESDMEDNSRSSTVAAVSKKPMLLKCVQCKGVNDNPFYRYCEKCYQVRKKIFPPRPRRNRTRDKKSKKSSSEDSQKKSIVEPEKLRKYLTTLTQHDSGIGSSQETVSSESGTTSTTDQLPVNLNLDKIIVPEELIETKSNSESQNPSSKTNGDINNDMLNEKEMCIVCATNPKNGIFVHGSFGHMCCCYKCAVKVWTRTKRCPACNCKVKNVLKVFLR